MAAAAALTTAGAVSTAAAAGTEMTAAASSRVQIEDGFGVRKLGPNAYDDIKAFSNIGASITTWIRTGGQFYNVWSGYCLDVEGNSNAHGAKLVEQPCDGSAHQTWSTSSAGSSARLLLRNAGSGLYATVPGQLVNGAQANQQVRNSNGLTQEFTIRTVR